MDVNSEVFGDPCPGTHKYVEVHFACAPRLLATTTKRPLPPWFLQGGADNLWNNPNESNNPTSSSTTANATNPTVATKNIFSISDVVPHVTDKRKPILVTSVSPHTSIDQCTFGQSHSNKALQCKYNNNLLKHIINYSIQRWFNTRLCSCLMVLDIAVHLHQNSQSCREKSWSDHNRGGTTILSIQVPHQIYCYIYKEK